MFEEQARWSKEGGAEFIIAETISFSGEACLAVKAIKNVGLPAVVNLAIDADGLLRDGYTPEESCRRLADLGADVVGLNCYQGPATMLPILKKITENVKGHVAALPVAYRTTEHEPTFEVRPPVTKWPILPGRPLSWGLISLAVAAAQLLIISVPWPKHWVARCLPANILRGGLEPQERLPLRGCF
jgi:hypothetical protein